MTNARDSSTNITGCEITRPWTPGLWAITDRIQHRRTADHVIRQVEDGCKGLHVVTTRGHVDADAALIALAPEMAEVVLEVGRYLSGMGNCHGMREERLLAAYAKLRAIGEPEAVSGNE